MCCQSQIRTLHLCHSRPDSLLHDSGLNLIQMHHVSRNGTLQKNDYIKFSDSNLETFTIPGLQKHENEVHCSLETTTNDRHLFYELFIKPKLSILKCLLYTSFTIIVISIWSLGAGIRIRTRSTQREAVGGHGKKMAICKPKREHPEETEPAPTLILGFQSAGL